MKHIIRHIHRRVQRRMKRHQKRHLSFIEALRIYAGLPVGMA